MQGNPNVHRKQRLIELATGAGAAVVGAAIVRTAVTKIKSCSFCMAVTCFATKTCPTRFITAVLMVSTPAHSSKPSFVASQQINICKQNMSKQICLNKHMQTKHEQTNMFK